MFTAAPLRYDMVVSEKIFRTPQGENLFEKIFTLRNNLPAIFITDYADTIDFNYATLDKIVMLLRPYDPTVLKQAVATLFQRRDRPDTLRRDLSSSSRS